MNIFFLHTLYITRRSKISLLVREIKLIPQRMLKRIKHEFDKRLLKKFSLQRPYPRVQ